MAKPANLTDRELDIMTVLWDSGSCTVAEVRQKLDDDVTHNTVQKLLSILEDKGHVRHEADGPRYLYIPSLPRSRARRTALRHLLQTFFDGSAGEAVVALLDRDAGALSPDQLDRIEALIAKARRREGDLS
jgi:predicted transcriptional regulator